MSHLSHNLVYLVCFHLNKVPKGILSCCVCCRESDADGLVLHRVDFMKTELTFVYFNAFGWIFVTERLLLF